jgi:hypothetical protein
MSKDSNKGPAALTAQHYRDEGQNSEQRHQGGDNRRCRCQSFVEHVNACSADRKTVQWVMRADYTRASTLVTVRPMRQPSERDQSLFKIRCIPSWRPRVHGKELAVCRCLTTEETIRRGRRHAAATGP